MFLFVAKLQKAFDISVHFNIFVSKILLMRISKKRYLQGFSLIVIFLGFVRAVFPSIAEDKIPVMTSKTINEVHDIQIDENTIKEPLLPHSQLDSPIVNVAGLSSDSNSIYYLPDGSLKKNKIYSVSSYAKAFPDSNVVQLEAAKRWGIQPMEEMKSIEKQRNKLVFIGSNPYFFVEKLTNSTPYLVPRAALLLQDIGRNFFDSLQVKGIPLHKLIITSVLRAKNDIKKLQNYNKNATENSCHLYATTFDISYNRYLTVQDPDGPEMRKVRNDSLKWILCEVLNDMRTHSRCWIKYEVKQGCFHITVR